MGRLPPNPKSAQAKRDAAEAKARAEMEAAWLALRITTLAWAEADAAEARQEAAADPAMPAQVEQKAAELADMVEVKLSHVEQPPADPEPQQRAHPASVEQLAELYDYDPDSGRIVWRRDAGRGIKAGSIAGYIREDGRRILSVGRYRVPAARVAWTLAHGEWPDHEIGHRNGDNSDDRLENLIDLPRGIHHLNSVRARKGSRSQWPNALERNGTRYIAKVGRRQLGTFDTPQEATAVAWQYKQEIGVCYRPDEMLPIPTGPLSK